MTQVTIAALAYIATQVGRKHRPVACNLEGPLLKLLPPINCLDQVRFALSSSPVFSRSDLVTDSETFYNSIIDLLEDPEEQAEVRLLLGWWNK
jgi:hypothetical protein